jgi:protein TonB
MRMAYLENNHTHRRLAGITGVALVHVVLALGLTAGLTIKEIIVDGETKLEGILIPLPPLPEPTETPQPTQDAKIIDVPETAPRPPIEVALDRRFVEVVDPVDNFPLDTVVDRGVIIEPRQQPYTPPAQPTFTPRNPAPSNGPSGWVTTEDYPRIALTRGWEGSLSYQLDVSPAGRVEDCRVTSSTGYDVLDQTACRQITRRARFRPATDQRGADVSGIYRGSVTWQIPED